MDEAAGSETKRLIEAEGVTCIFLRADVTSAEDVAGFVSETESRLGAIEAFANTDAVYHAWPYWREFVQSSMARMGLPPIMIPLFRPGGQGEEFVVDEPSAKRESASDQGSSPVE